MWRGLLAQWCTKKDLVICDLVGELTLPCTWTKEAWNLTFWGLNFFACGVGRHAKLVDANTTGIYSLNMSLSLREVGGVTDREVNDCHIETQDGGDRRNQPCGLEACI
jgi:hypothetical protein